MLRKPSAIPAPRYSLSIVSDSRRSPLASRIVFSTRAAGRSLGTSRAMSTKVEGVEGNGRKLNRDAGAVTDVDWYFDSPGGATGSDDTSASEISMTNAGAAHTGAS